MNGGKRNRENIHMSKCLRGLSVEDKDGWFLDELTLKQRLGIAENLPRQGASS